MIIAQVGVSAFVRKGAAKPDISSADAFKRSMFVARSIIYPDPPGGGASGVYMASLLERLGIAAEMKPKTKLSPSAKVLYASVASADVEIGFNRWPAAGSDSELHPVHPWHRYRQQSG
jgi:molybdate transport system substrate-binding protein